MRQGRCAENVRICRIGRAPGQAKSSPAPAELFVRSIEGHVAQRRPPYQSRRTESTVDIGAASMGC